MYQGRPCELWVPDARTSIGTGAAQTRRPTTRSEMRCRYRGTGVMVVTIADRDRQIMSWHLSRAARLSPGYRAHTCGKPRMTESVHFAFHEGLP